VIQSVGALTRRLRDLELDKSVKVNVTITTQSAEHTARMLGVLADIRAASEMDLPEVDAAACDGAVHCVIAPATKARAPKVQLHGFVAFLETATDAVQPIIVVPDTAAEATVISASVVQPTWETVSTRIDSVSGVGGDSKLKEKTSVPIRFRYGGTLVRLLAYPAESALSELRGAHMIIGLKEMGLLKMKFNAGDRSLQLTVNGNTTVLFLEPVSTLKLRLESKPLRVCTFCNAAEFVQYSIRDLGWPIEDWEAHDIDPVARSIAQASFPGIRHPDPQDVLKLPVSYLADKSELVDLVLITTECVTFSKAKVAPPPLGFDDPRADPLVHMSKMIRQGIAAGKIAFFIREQVTVHSARGCS
jgi:hypothetical protein